jgi:hypothetical protein
MKTWYYAVCDKCGEALNVFVNNPSCTEAYLGKFDAEIQEWLSKHYGCELRFIHSDIHLDKLWEEGYKHKAVGSEGIEKYMLVRGKYVKYPHTVHLPWTQAVTDDEILTNVNHLVGKSVVVTEKMDGENTTMYTDHIHARSIDSRNHPSRTWIKNLWGRLRTEIPETWRVCGENLFAKHTIYYTELDDVFQVFNIWDGDTCLSWNETKEWCQLLGLSHVPVLYEGIWDEAAVKACWTGKSRQGGDQEGYVVRVAEKFNFDQFGTSLAKFVRKNHVQTSDHWLDEPVVPNLLKVRVQRFLNLSLPPKP